MSSCRVPSPLRAGVVDDHDEDRPPVDRRAEESISSSTSPARLAELLTDSQGARFLSFQRRRGRVDATRSVDNVSRTPLFFPEQASSTADDSSHDGMNTGVDENPRTITASEVDHPRSNQGAAGPTLFYGGRAERDEGWRYHPSSGLGGADPRGDTRPPRLFPADPGEGLIARNRDFAAVARRFRGETPFLGGSSPLSGGGPVRRAVDEEK